MAMYLCAICDKMLDNDYHPCEPWTNNQLICPECALEKYGDLDDFGDVIEALEKRDKRIKELEITFRA